MATTNNSQQDQKKKNIIGQVKEHAELVLQSTFTISKAFFSEFNKQVKIYGDLSTLHDMIANPASAEAAVKAFFSDSFEPVENDFCSNIRNLLTTGQSGCLTQADKNIMLAEIDKIKTELLNKFIYVELVTSGIVIIIQSANLITTWRELAKAENVLFESEKDKETIQGEIDVIVQDICKLQKNIRHFAEELSINLLSTKEDDHANDPITQEVLQKYKDNREERGQKMDKFIIEINRLKRKKINVEKLLDKVSLKINGSIENLKIRRNTNVKDGIIDTAHLLGNIYGLYKTATNPFNLLISLKYGITFAFGVLLTANAVTVVITSKKLKELRKQMEEVNKLSEVFDQAHKNIEILYEWIEQIDAHQAKCRGIVMANQMIDPLDND